MKSLGRLRASSPAPKLCRRGICSSQLLLRAKRGPAVTPAANHKTKSKLGARTQQTSAAPAHDPASRARLAQDKKGQGRYGLLRSVILSQFQTVLSDLEKNADTINGVGADELHRQSVLFMDVLDNSFKLAEQNVTRQDKNPLFWSLRDAFITTELKGLTKEIRYSFQAFMVRNQQDKKMDERADLDLRFPHEWFPATRRMQRTIHVHVGPTNSGKTYQALKALENAKSGVYAGPLRLLATETYMRLMAKGKKCALLTGEEVKIPDDANNYFTSCTVEMIPLHDQMDVAVIDEIQMLEDEFRGSAWTFAVLGVQAKEVHVCGEVRAVEAVQRLAAMTGDKCVVHRYERLSPLETSKTALDGDFNQLEKGDAIVAFSRLNLHMVKRQVEAQTGRRCAIVYGGLPPEVRVQQAALFNDPDNDYDYIAASDAIGMGLNLEIRRVIMDSVTKFDGTRQRMLRIPEIKQIGGRAGRYRSAHANNAEAQKTQETAAASEPQFADAIEDAVVKIESKRPPGYVTAMDHRDLRAIKKAFQTEPAPIEQCTIFPPSAVIEHFAKLHPAGTPLSFILMRIRTKAVFGKNFQFQVDPDKVEMADLIQDIPLTMQDRLTFIFMPSVRAPGNDEICRALARKIANNEEARLLEIKEIPFELLDENMKTYIGRARIDYLQRLECLFVALSQYSWLAYRYSGVFVDQDMALQAREMVNEKLIEVLEDMNFTDRDLDTLRTQRRVMAEKSERKRSRLVQTAGGEGQQDGEEGERSQGQLEYAQS